MKHKKFVSIASSLGLSVGLLAGCGVDKPVNEKEEKRQSGSSGAFINGSNSQNSSGSGAGIVGGNNSQSSKGTVGGSKGIGTSKGGGAGS